MTSDNDPRPWLRMCMICGRVRDYDIDQMRRHPGDGEWETREGVSDERYRISHGYCEACFEARYGAAPDKR